MSATGKGKLFISTRPARDESVNGKAQARRRSLTPSPSPRSRRGSRTDRNSFVSVREDDGGIAQTFVDSKKSPLSAAPTYTVEEAVVVVDDSPIADLAKMATAMTMAPQAAHCCPCGRLDEWKAIRLRGRRMSRSTEDLRSRRRHDVEMTDAVDEAPEAMQVAREPSTYPAGRSPLESLPLEVTEQILLDLMVDVPPNGSAHRNVDLISCLLTSRTMGAATLNVLYRNVTFPHSLIFFKFLAHLNRYPALGTLVRRLDFSHFSSVGLGRTRRMNSEIQMVTSETLTQGLELTPRLREFLAQEHLDGDINDAVLHKLFGGLPLLQAVDFCGCSASSFRDAMARVISPANPTLPLSLTIERLSLHECGTLPASVFEALLPRLPRLTHLDLSHTLVTAAALSRLPDTARLTHLNLSKCARLTGDAVVSFVTTHPAARHSLVYLNLLSDPSRYRMLLEADVTNLLPGLPATLRALNLNGAEIVRDHVPLLAPLTKHVEELGLASAELSLDDIQSFWRPTSTNDEESTAEKAWVPPALHYIDLTGVSAITPAALLSSSCILLQPSTQPLEVIELSSKAVAVLRERLSAKARPGWVIREIGRRSWYVRARPGDGSIEDDRRSWKMGALWWGMRKVPVARSEVGGLYGHYMFKR